MPLPSVSVILVNYKGADLTIEAVERLREVEYPAELLEIVVVDNASPDDSAARLAQLEGVVFIPSATNTGFAGGCNLGVARSSGEIVAFLNSDAKPDPGWVRAAVEAFASSPRVGAVASRVLDWDGELVDYIGAGMTWFGMGYKPHTAERPPKRVGIARERVLFGTGSAMFVRRDVFDRLGGFDERYFMFFEDVDLGWRLNLLGYHFVYEPDSLAYHKHHASMEGFGAFKEQYLLERNALFTLYKNAGGEVLAEALPAALALAVRRSVEKGGVDSASLDLRVPGGDDAASVDVPKITMSGVYAIDQFVEALDALRIERDRIQSGRVVSDTELWPLFGRTDMPADTGERYLAGYEDIVSAFDVVEAPVTPKVLIITGDPIGRRLAGPAIRAWNMARELGRGTEVRLLTLSGVEEGYTTHFPVVHVAPGDEDGLGPQEEWADVIVFQGHALALFDTLHRSKKLLVADIYDPMHLEQLEQGRPHGEAVWRRQVDDATQVLNEQLLRADYMMCASERQRMFWLGQLAGLGRINPDTYADDPDLAHLLSVVPFGLADEPPHHERDVLKGVVPGIGRDDKVLLWSGGLYDWFDPHTLIRAVAELAARRPNVRLYFQGTRHPHPGVPEMSIVGTSRELAEELGVLDVNVFFNPEWVDYDDRQNYLLEADAGVSTHFSHIETTFSFRTRILDYLWAGLPMVVTRGDHFGDLVAREGLGIAVPARDSTALAAALETVLFDTAFAAEARANIERVRGQYAWSRVLEPLVAYIARPTPAADRSSGRAGAFALADRPRKRRKRSGFLHDMRLAFYYLKEGGVSTLIEKVKGRVRRSAR